MKVILREDIDDLGKSGELVTVKDGFGRNYLLPRKMAVLASEQNLRQLEHEKAVISARNAKLKGAAEEQAKKLGAVKVTIKRKVGEQDKLFGSVTALDIAEALAAQGQQVDRRRLHLPEPIKARGQLRGGAAPAPRRVGQDQGRGRAGVAYADFPRRTPGPSGSLPGGPFLRPCSTGAARAGLFTSARAACRVRGKAMSTTCSTVVKGGRSTRISPRSARCWAPCWRTTRSSANVAEVVHSEDFASPAHAAIFAAMLELDGTQRHGGPPDAGRGAEGAWASWPRWAARRT